MAENTKIEWADHTFNPWIGCTNVSPACDHCYAEAWGKRFGVAWGAGQPRRRTSEANWRKPHQWNARCARLGIREAVFCASLADWADKEIPAPWRTDLLNTIRETPHLNWLLLSKRHALLKTYLPKEPLPNVRVGVTVENDEMAQLRLPALGMLGLKGWNTFISYEPALGPVNWWPWFDPEGIGGPDCFGWLIAGGESGPNARPSHPDWYRVARDACERANIPFLFKQVGEWAFDVGPHIPVPRERLAWVRDDGRVATADEVERIERREGPQNWKQIARVGKKAAGALLDGREHREFPA